MAGNRHAYKSELVLILDTLIFEAKATKVTTVHYYHVETLNSSLATQDNYPSSEHFSPNH